VPLLLRALDPAAALRLVAVGVVVSVALVVVRTIWIFPTGVLAPLVRGEPRPPRLLAQSVVLSWAGMRGVVSLAVALALPLTLPAGGPFPAREAALTVTLTVIVFTLLGQGLTLPWLIRRLRLGTDSEVREEEATARQQMIEAASRRIDQLYQVWPGHRPLLDRLRDTYLHRSEHVERQHEVGVLARHRVVESAVHALEALAGHRLHVSHTDGNPLVHPVEVDAVPIAPGERYDVLVVADHPRVRSTTTYCGRCSGS